MASRFPQFVLIKHKGDTSNMATMGYKGDVDGVPGSVMFDGIEGMFNPMAKIEVEVPSKTENAKYFHLRYVLNNKYLARNNDKDGYITAVSTKPEEDKTKASCTLFEASASDAEDYFSLIHVQSGGHVGSRKGNPRVVVVTPAPKEEDVRLKVGFVDAETIIKLPKHIAIKGDNNKYLQGVVVYGHNYLQFSSDDRNANASGHEVVLHPNGYVRIKSDRFGLFWRLSPGWIWGDSPDHTDNIDDTLFWPTKIDEKTLVLRNKGNGKFCRRLTAENNENCLNAYADGMIKETYLTVEELVLESKINNVKYRLDESRIYNEAPYVAGSGTEANKGDKDSSFDIEVEYTVEKSYSFGGSFSMTAGVSATVEAGIPEIVNASVTVSTEITKGIEWGKTETSTVKLKAKVTVPVPAKHSVTAKYVGTKGSCSVPFSYKRQDKSSVDGKVYPVEMLDGLFNGVSCYNFYFEVEKAKPLTNETTTK